MRFRRVEQRQTRKEPALVVREETLIARPLNFGCDAAIFMDPRIMLGLFDRSTRIVPNLSSNSARPHSSSGA